MSFWTQLRMPTEQELLVGFYDLAGYMQSAGREWLGQRGFKTSIVVKLHRGPIAIGRVGSPGEEIIDVYGKTVNVAAALPSSGLAVTPAVFRSLQAETRKLFKKHTPPISYIDMADARPD